MICVRCAVLAVVALSISAAGSAASPADEPLYEIISSEPSSVPAMNPNRLARALDFEVISEPPSVPAVGSAMSPTALFEAVSASIVVVYGKDGEGRRRSLGSGVVIARGEVVTNCHVIEHAVTLSVTHRNRDYPATLKDADYERDVCSLTVTGFDAPAVELGETQSLKIGQKVFAIGAPYGLELTLSEGLISGLRDVPSGRMLQISAPISPGSSGGGLFDERGRLIGLLTSLPQRRTTAEFRRAGRVGHGASAAQHDDEAGWPADAVVASSSYRT